MRFVVWCELGFTLQYQYSRGLLTRGSREGGYSIESFLPPPILHRSCAQKYNLLCSASRYHLFPNGSVCTFKRPLATICLTLIKPQHLVEWAKYRLTPSAFQFHRHLFIACNTSFRTFRTGTHVYILLWTSNLIRLSNPAVLMDTLRPGDSWILAISMSVFRIRWNFDQIL